MLNLNEFFSNYNIECPKWLEDKQIEEIWLNSDYSNEDNTHKWTLKNSIPNLVLTFDGETYLLQGFIDEDLIFQQMITEDEEAIT